MFKARRPITLGNKKYLVEEEIPKEAILPTRVRDLKNSGLIVEIPDSPNGSKPQKTADAGIKKEKVIKKIYSTEKLQALKKEDLIKIAKENQIATDGLTVKELIDAIKNTENS